MGKDELKKCLIEECEGSGLSCEEVKKTIDEISVYFFMREREILRSIPIKRQLDQDTEKHDVMADCEDGAEELKKQVRETVAEVYEARKQSRQSLQWSVTALIISIAAGVIQVAVKVL